MAKKKRRKQRNLKWAALALLAASSFLQQIGNTAERVGQAATQVDGLIARASDIFATGRPVTKAELESLRTKQVF